MPLADKVEQFIDENNFNIEGSAGVQSLTTLVKALGYGEMFQDPLHAFFADNSGAIQAVIEWIGTQRSAEWEASLDEQLCPEEEYYIEEDDE